MKIPRTRSQILEESYNEKNVSLILDLDNTLIYSSYKKIEQIKDYTIMDKLYVYKRPFIDKLLNDVD
jgi:TFIIF-interacting CTD phosphatase-like protein